MNENTNAPVVTPQPEVGPTPVAAKKGKALIPILLIAVAAIVVVLAVVFKVVSSSPKKAYTNFINDGFKEVNKGLDRLDKVLEIMDFKEKAVTLEASAKVDANLDGMDESLKNLKDVEFKASVGVDLKDEQVLGVASINDIEFQGMIDKDAGFLKTSFYKDIIKMTAKELGIDISEYENMADELTDSIDVDAKLYKEIAESVRKALVNSLQKDAMSKESAKISILGKDVKATKNTYTVTDKVAKKMVKSIVKDLSKDKDFIKNVAKATGVDEDDVKEMLEQLEEEADEIKGDEKIKINIYTRGLTNKYSGFDISLDKEKLVSYYTDGKNIEAKLSDMVKITAEKDGKEHKVKVKYNGEEIATAKVRQFDENAIDLDFNVTSGDEEVSGTIMLTYEEKKDSVGGKYKFKVEYGKQYASIEGTYGLSSSKDLDLFSTSGAKTVDEVDAEAFGTALEEAIKKDKALEGLYDLISSMAEDVFDDDYDYDYDHDYDYDYDDDWGSDWDSDYDYDYDYDWE